MRWRLSPGTAIDGFELQEHLGTGGMAQLWAVAREGDPTPLVMKIPLLIDSDDPAAHRLLRDRADDHAAALGRACAPLRRNRPLEPMPYIVMERIPGESLKNSSTRCRCPGPRSSPSVRRWRHALHDLHRQHVIHLDMKPSNMMIRASGEAVLIDFGFARHEHLPDLLAEEFRVPFGTRPTWRRSRCCRTAADPRSDLFALGVMLYFFITGERPFGNPRDARGIRRRLWRDPVPPRALRPDCPPWLQEIILRCLEVEPLDRYATAAQLAFDLAQPGSGEADRRAPSAWNGIGGMKTFRRWLKARKAQPLEDAQHRRASSPGRRSCSSPSISRRAARTWPIPCA